jgi:ketosteroid isomerase-like protein
MCIVTKTLSFVILCFLLVSVSVIAQDTDEMKSTIQEWNDQFSQAMMNGDNEKMLSFYADDIISMPSYAPMLEGKKALKNAMEMDSNSGKKFTKFNLTSKKLLSEGNLLVDIGTYELTVEMEGMDKPIDDQGKYVTVYEKQNDGSWKIKVDTWNSDLNPWMSNDNVDENKSK